MKLLLDTHILLWALVRTEKLKPAVREALEDLDNSVSFSVISIWEIGIKAALRREDFNVDPEAILAMALSTGFVESPIDCGLAISASRLPMHHRDPFDRMIVAQALETDTRLVTADTKLALYAESVWLV